MRYRSGRLTMESLLVISPPDSGHRRAAGWDPKDSLAVFTCDVNRVHEKNRASSHPESIGVHRGVTRLISIVLKGKASSEQSRESARSEGGTKQRCGQVRTEM